MCEDLQAFIASMNERNVPCQDPTDQGWGILTRLTLPGGSDLGVYQPRHTRPPNP